MSKSIQNVRMGDSMSYCRWGDESAVYMIGVDDGIYCCSCKLNGPHLFKTRTDAIDHLLRHRDNGDKVPDYAFELLKKEIESDGDEYCKPVTRIHNKEKMITNTQLDQVMNLINPEENNIRKIAFFQTRRENWLYIIKNIKKLKDVLLMLPCYGTDALYNPLTDAVSIYVYTIDKVEKEQLQFQIICRLVFVCRIRHYFYDYLKEQDVSLVDTDQLEDTIHCLRLVLGDYRSLIEKYLLKFMVEKAAELAKIMDWKTDIETIKGWKEDITFDETGNKK
ncbi:MAG: hypothetical protein PVG90_06430 [Bacillota bacterium]